MSMRDFLLAYAEKAPKAGLDRGLLEKPNLRFTTDDNDLVCPLELAAESYPGDYRRSAKEFGLTYDETGLIVDAADGGGTPEDSHWRAVLLKLAEPEARS